MANGKSGRKGDPGAPASLRAGAGDAQGRVLALREQRALDRLRGHHPDFVAGSELPGIGPTTLAILTDLGLAERNSPGRDGAIGWRLAPDGWRCMYGRTREELLASGERPFRPLPVRRWPPAGDAPAGPLRVRIKPDGGRRMPPNTVRVGRGTPWVALLPGGGRRPMAAIVALFAERLAGDAALAARARAALRGRNLACGCRLCPAHAAGKPFAVDCPDCAPCHADVPGRLANAG